jgi:2'-5' RNA ligase
MVDDRLAFRLLWLAGSARLRMTGARRCFELPAQGPQAAHHLTTVVRIPGGVADALTAAQTRLRHRDPTHYYYPPQTMHFTVANLDHAPSHLVDQLPSLLGGLRRFEVAVQGLGVSPTTVFAQVLADDAAVRELRARLAALAPRSASFRLLDTLMRNVAVVNIVRFSGSVSAPFLTEVARMRKQRFGRFSVAHVELVRTDRLLSDAGTHALEVLALTDAG